jgi:hypothetical protein
MNPAPGQYWRRTKQDDNYDALQKGVLVLVTDVTPHEIGARLGESGWTFDPAEFMDEHEYAPDGLQEKLAGLTDALDLAGQTVELPDSVAMLTAPGSDPESSALVSTKAPAKLRKEIGKVRNAVTKQQKVMMAKIKEVRATLAEQERFLMARVEKMNKFVQRAEEAIWTINLYLGKDEEIVQLRKGKPAPKDTKVSVRQLVLHMDEECAVGAEYGGVDADSIDDFDTWVAEGKNVEQLLPEPRGIVALRVRREAKDYGLDPLSNAEKNAENFKTYFLIRNGERLYRVCPDMNVGKTLYPTASEQQDFFFEMEHDWETGERRKVPIRPGSHGYMDAMKKADESRRHYMRVALVIQGLLDRTKVFAPFSVPRLDLSDRNMAEEYIAFVRDAEMTLGDGRPSFHDWLRAANARMDVGMRVMGVFSGYSFSRYDRGENKYKPESYELYTLEDERDGGFVFRFHYDRWHGATISAYPKGDAKPEGRRVGYKVHKTDSFILCFDTVSIEEMEYYLRSRIHRHAYIEMFPLLKTAIILKRREVEEEEPFRVLLASRLVQKHGITNPRIAREEADDLVTWWKYKNRTHRGIKEDDAKALRMCLKEAKVRRDKRAEAEAVEEVDGPVIKALRKAVKKAIYVGHVRGSKYVVLAAMNDDNLFVRKVEYRLSLKSGELKATKDQDWVLLNKEQTRWREMWSDPRWKDWTFGVRMAKVLTDPEIKQGVEEAFKQMEERDRYSRRWHRSVGFRDKEELPKRALRFAATWDTQEYALRVYGSVAKQVLPEQHLTERYETTYVEYGTASWTRGSVREYNKETRMYEQVPPKLRFNFEFRSLHTDDNEKPWVHVPDKKTRRHAYDHHGNEHTRVVFENDEAWAVWQQEIVERKAWDKEHARLSKIVRAYRGYVEANMEKAVIAKEKADFMENIGDEELWAAHLEEKTIRGPDAQEFAGALEYLIERGIDVAGKTVKWVYTQAKKYGHEGGGSSRWGRSRYEDRQNLERVWTPWKLKLPVYDEALETAKKADMLDWFEDEEDEDE